MNQEFDPHSLKFLIDHITRQCQLVKSDIRQEMHQVRETLKDHKDEVEQKLLLTDERIDSLSKFKWQAVGIISFLVVALGLLVEFLHK